MFLFYKNMKVLHFSKVDLKLFFVQQLKLITKTVFPIIFSRNSWSNIVQYKPDKKFFLIFAG